MDNSVVIASVTGGITMVVTSVANYFVLRLKADQWVTNKFDVLIDDLRKRLTSVEAENKDCQAKYGKLAEKYAELSEILRFITPVQGPAE